MTVRFLTAVADGALGSFMEGRVITIDPAAPDYPIFERWLKDGLIEAVRTGHDGRPSMAPERAIAQPAPRTSRGSGRGARSSASAAGPG
jgi:hypothetical protein